MLETNCDYFCAPLDIFIGLTNNPAGPDMGLERKSRPL